MVPSTQAHADCVRILADPSVNADERQACRAVMAAAESRTPAPSSAVAVLARYVRKQQEQDRWGR